MNELHFELNVEDDWPPVAVEGVLVSYVNDAYKIESPPLFVKGISVGDLINVKLENNMVISWEHLSESKRSTIWLLRMKEPSGISVITQELKQLGCSVVALENQGVYAIDVPEECEISEIDECLDKLDESKVAVAYPSFRHSD